MKVCSKCHVLKEIELFHKKHDSRDGRNTVCKACKNIQQQERRPDSKKKVCISKNKKYAIPCIPSPTYPQRLAMQVLEHKTDLEEIRYSLPFTEEGDKIYFSVLHHLRKWRVN